MPISTGRSRDVTPLPRAISPSVLDQRAPSGLETPTAITTGVAAAETLRQQLCRDRRRGSPAHIEQQRRRGVGKPTPVEIVWAARRCVHGRSRTARNGRDRGASAIRRGCRQREPGADAWHDGDGNALPPPAGRSPRRRGRRSSGSPDFSRTTCLPCNASLIISALMSSCAQLSRRPRLPTSIRLASRRASSRTSSETRSSNRITSADCSARTAFSVSSSASPGPAPTRVTRPAAAGVPAAISSDQRRARPSAAGHAAACPNARSENRSQKPAAAARPTGAH